MGEVDWRKLMRSKRFKQFSLVFAIFLIGFATRYITKHQLLFDPDSYWWYQLAMYFAGIDDGRLQYFHKVGGKTIYELAYYPTGRVLEKELLLLPFTIGFSYKILGIFGAPQTPEGLLNYMFFFGPFFGALTAVLAYFLGKELTGSDKAGFVAAVFYSFAHFAMTRNTAGDTGQESLGSFFLFLMVYLFIVSVKQKELKLNVGYAIASGIVFLLAANTWGGTSFYWGLIASAVFVYLAVNVALNRPLKEYKSVCVSFPVFILIGVFIPSLFGIGNSYVIGKMSTHNVFQNLSYLIVIICLFLIGYEELRKKKELSLQPRVIFLGTIVIVVLGLFATGKFVIFERISDFIYRLIFAPEEKGLTGKTVAYYRSTGFTEFKGTFGALLLAIPAGFLLIGYDLYKKREFTSLFMIFFMILGIVAFRWMIRLSYLMAFILPLFIAFLFARYIDKQKPQLKHARPKKKKDAQESQGMRRFNIVIGFAVLLFLISPILVTSIQSLKAQKFADQSVMPWKDAGEWIKKNTPENALLIHWWDYGYHLQTFAIRRTIVDGGNIGPIITGKHRNIDVAKAFTSPEEDFYKYIAPYNPDNLPIYVLVSVEEFGKSGAINFHAQDELFISPFRVQRTGDPKRDNANIQAILQRYGFTTYALVNAGNSYMIWGLHQRDARGNYHPEWANKVLAKLLPFNTGMGKGMKHFRLVYHNGYVYIYRYIP